MSGLYDGTLPAGETEVEPRTGDVVRVVLARSVTARCRDCDRGFPSTGAAASHARGSRHRVDCDYGTSFVFLPVESVGPS